MAVRSARALGRGEPVRVVSLGPGGLPLQFTFRGRRYRVRSIAAGSEAATQPSGSRRLEERMEVRTESGLRAILCRQHSNDRWRMERILQ